MDKLNLYQQIIITLLEEIAAKPYANAPDIQQQVIADTQRGHFQLINVGWHKHQFVFAPILHFDLHDQKVWVQQNATELEIADELIRRGVAPTDIVLGFIPEKERGLVHFNPA